MMRQFPSGMTVCLKQSNELHVKCQEKHLCKCAYKIVKKRIKIFMVIMNECRFHFVCKRIIVLIIYMISRKECLDQYTKEQLT